MQLRHWQITLQELGSSKKQHYFKFLILGIFLTGTSLFAGIFLGNLDAPLSELFKGLINKDDGIISTIIWQVRIPRLLSAIISGACLGLGGLLIQTSTKSPLGDPNLFGVGGGAVFLMSFAIAGIVPTGNLSLFLLSCAGALIIGIVFAFTTSKESLTPIKLALVGIALGALSLSLSAGVISYGNVFPSEVLAIITGSFSASTWNSVQISSTGFVVSIFSALILANSLNVLLLGGNIPKTLSVNPNRMRFMSMVLVGILTASSVHLGGIVGFVGLVAPHISRKIIGNNPFKLILMSSFIGGYFVLTADQLARLLFSPVELPVGLITTFIGAPMMIYIGVKLK